MPITKKSSQQNYDMKGETEREWYELIPYGYGILEPGEWFWLTHRYPDSKEESKPTRTSTEADTASQRPQIRITFRARK